MSQGFAVLLSKDIVLSYKSIVKSPKQLKFSTEESEHAEKSPFVF